MFRWSENSEPSAAWLKTCRARPLEAAVSLIESVRSFADAGYFDAEHFLDGRKFSLSEDGAVYLVDTGAARHVAGSKCGGLGAPRHVEGPQRNEGPDLPRG